VAVRPAVIEAVQRVGPDAGAIADGGRTDQHGTGADLHVVAKDGRLGGAFAAVRTTMTDASVPTGQTAFLGATGHMRCLRSSAVVGSSGEQLV
jgi:hypothetical protein